MELPVFADSADPALLPLAFGTDSTLFEEDSCLAVTDFLVAAAAAALPRFAGEGDPQKESAPPQVVPPQVELVLEGGVATEVAAVATVPEVEGEAVTGAAC